MHPLPHVVRLIPARIARSPISSTPGDKHPWRSLAGRLRRVDRVGEAAYHAGGSALPRGAGMEFDIQRQGRRWTRAEVEQKYHRLCPEKIELIEGKMFWTDEERLNMLGLLLENVGMDAAVRLGDPALWKQAIDDRLQA
jgi:hypothetical protein